MCVSSLSSEPPSLESHLKRAGMVLCKGAKRERSHAQDALASEHGEHPPLAQVLSVCWLSYQAREVSVAQGMIPLSLVSWKRTYREGAKGDRPDQNRVGLPADTFSSLHPSGDEPDTLIHRAKP